ncbi:MAG: PilZ domain-containing protein [Myxococcota bacterium]
MARSPRADFQAGELFGCGTVSNVSEGGLFIETPSVPDLGDSVELTLSAPDGAALQLCEMVWWTPSRRRAASRLPCYP